jgi:hypothetical protein
MTAKVKVITKAQSQTTRGENSRGKSADLAVSDLPVQYNTEAESPPPPDCVEIASMDSFPCSDPPGYYAIRL